MFSQTQGASNTNKSPARTGLLSRKLDEAAAISRPVRLPPRVRMLAPPMESMSLKLRLEKREKNRVIQMENERLVDRLVSISAAPVSVPGNPATLNANGGNRKRAQKRQTAQESARDWEIARENARLLQRINKHGGLQSSTAAGKGKSRSEYSRAKLDKEWKAARARKEMISSFPSAATLAASAAANASLRESRKSNGMKEQESVRGSSGPGKVATRNSKQPLNTASSSVRHEISYQSKSSNEEGFEEYIDSHSRARQDEEETEEDADDLTSESSRFSTLFKKVDENDSSPSSLYYWDDFEAAVVQVDESEGSAPLAA